ncbi:hypothetical protein PIB30_046119 [Stylosanthes scabra]|uniref:Uncharacterized protein n=1 Tax=Stylosanthes scabra TaxID=79078 RepID=A0ABU6ZF35_9FABA|nr:hypothetical protein [Stylosanthes scabra]
MTNRSLLLTGIKRLGYVFGARSLASASRASSASYAPLAESLERAGDAKRNGIWEVLKSRELSPLHALQRNSFSHSELRSIARNFFNSKRYLHALEVRFFSALFQEKCTGMDGKPEGFLYDAG